MDLGDLFLRFIDQFHEVLRTADASGMESSGLPDVTIHQFFYLQEIERNENITLTELAQILGVTKPSVTAAVTKLMKDGFVSRTRSSEDQRKYHLALTERGHQIILNKQRAYKKYVEQLELATTDEEQKILVNAFRIMTACFPVNE